MNKRGYRSVKATLMKELSDFEKNVLKFYLSETITSYLQISKKISNITKQPCYINQIDNALLRIRRKAHNILKEGRVKL